MGFLSNFGKKEQVGGLIAFYGLTDWWLTEFTEQERHYISDHYRPMNFPANTLTQGNMIIRDHPVTEFLNILARWFRSKEDSYIADRIYIKIEEIGKENPIEGPGYYKGRHFTTYVNNVVNLKKDGRLDEAESLLIELVKATEAESKVDKMGVAPFYYEELAVIYRARKDYAKEVTILERFAKQRHAPGKSPPRLLERLEKARALKKKAQV